MSVVTSLLAFCLVLGFHRKVASLAGKISDGSRVLLAWLAVPVLNPCLLLTLLVISSLAANERCISLHAGGNASPRGWLHYLKILGNILLISW